MRCRPSYRVHVVTGTEKYRIEYRPTARRIDLCNELREKRMMQLTSMN
jgi:hypothetical protein